MFIVKYLFGSCQILNYFPPISLLLPSWTFIGFVHSTRHHFDIIEFYWHINENRTVHTERNINEACYTSIDAHMHWRWVANAKQFRSMKLDFQIDWSKNKNNKNLRDSIKYVCLYIVYYAVVSVPIFPYKNTVTECNMSWRKRFGEKFSFI